ncbi:MAG: AbrB/MazE/SpoVT family DNA-binding domain-containing protein [Acetobacteraceae bacterium]
MSLRVRKRKLHKVGGSVMLPVPPAVLDLLGLTAGSEVRLGVEDGRLIVDPQPRPRYTLASLLARSDYMEPQPPEEREWVEAPGAGREPL